MLRFDVVSQQCQLMFETFQFQCRISICVRVFDNHLTTNHFADSTVATTKNEAVKLLWDISV